MKRPLKIVYYSVHPDLNLSALSGPGTHMREVIRGFEEQSHKVIRLIAGGEVIASHSGQITHRRHALKRWIPSFVWHTLKDIRLLLHDRRMKRRLKDIVLREKPDLIYERAYYMCASGVRVARECNVTHFLELNAPYPEEKRNMEGRSALSWMADRKECAQVKGSDRVFVVSSALREYLISRVGNVDRKIRITPNAVNLNAIPDCRQSDERLRLGYEEGQTVVGFVGSIFAYHGVDVLVETFSRVVRSSPDMRLLIVGDGEVLPAVKDLAHKLGCADKIRFTGNVVPSEVFRYISAMDIAVMARSNWYGSPVKIFEYGALGKKIIAPDNIPVRDVMVHLRDGYLVNQTTEGLEEAIRYMVSHPTESAAMASHFREKVHREHVWSRVAEIILDEYP